MILPGQSYLAGVRGPFSYSVNKTNLSKFMLLSVSFGQPGRYPTHDPWTSVDNFGRSGLYKSLLSSYLSVLAGAKKVPVRSETEEQSSIGNGSAQKPPSRSKCRIRERSAFRSSSSSVVGAPPKGSTKD